MSFGCSSDGGSSPPADAGKKDTGAGTGGKGGGGGSSDTGGTTGTGGSSGKGGATSAGGSSGTGGSVSTGGSAGAAGTGSGGTAGAIGGASGGSSGGVDSGAGGSTGGTGGTSVIDGGNRDGSGDDAIDAPEPLPDGSADADASTPDVIGPVILDGALDQGGLDVEAIDTTVVRLDAEADSPNLDAEKLDVVVDVGNLADAADASAAACLQQIVSNGYTASAEAKCSVCQNSQPAHTSLEAQCKSMIDCLLAASCPRQTSPNNCWVNCRNQVSSDQIDTETCVAAMTDLVCQ